MVGDAGSLEVDWSWGLTVEKKAVSGGRELLVAGRVRVGVLGGSEGE